jgi:subtilase family serine protease
MALRTLVVLGIFVAAVLGAAQAPLPAVDNGTPEPVEIIADSQTEFSCTQGQNNWRYGYYDGPFISSDFQHMTQCIPNSHLNNADAWWVNPSLYWTSVAPAVSFPNGPASCGRQQVEHWAVRRWVSEVTGSIHIAGVVEQLSGGGDGFITHIIVDNVVVWSLDVITRSPIPYALDVTVNTGSVVDFAVQPKNSDCNDWAKFTATITVAGGLPNLRVTKLKGKAVAGAGAMYTAKDTTSNVGVGTAGASATKFYISNNDTWEPTDVLLQPVAGRSVPGLPTNQSSSGTTKVTIPANTPPSKQFLIARADATEAVGESNEGDNTTSKAIFVGPDLIVFELLAPNNASPGQMITVTDTTKNIGGAATTVTTKTRLYLSVNKNWDLSDVPLAPGRNVPPLAAGASNMATINVTIPPGTAPRKYFILARADDGSVQPESQETNNVKPKAIMIN